MHRLLVRQLRKAGVELADADPRVAALVAAVDEAYATADDDRETLERSLHLASDELFERNRRLERELEERKRLEVELQHADKLRAVGQLAAGVAHEINTPIQYVGDSIAFLADVFAALQPALATGEADAELGELVGEVPEALRRCREGVERVANIVRALKSLAHPGGREQQPADLGKAIRDTLTVCAGEWRAVAEVELDLQAARAVRCHVGEVQQVVLNLVINAAHAIADRVGASGDRGRIVVRTRDDGGDIVITIADDGAGIPADIRTRIFEPFFTTKPHGRGSGQGLSLARSMVVDHHRGTLSFDSTVGVGTVFYVRLPVGGRAPLA